MSRVLYRTALAVLLTGNAVGLAALVAAGHGLPPLLGAVTLSYCGVVVLCYAAGAAVHTGRRDACRRRHRQRPTQGPRAAAQEPRISGLDPEVVAADAAIADAYAAPSTGRRGVQLAPTVPMPQVDLSQWNAYEYRSQW